MARAGRNLKDHLVTHREELFWELGHHDCSTEHLMAVNVGHHCSMVLTGRTEGVLCGAQRGFFYPSSCEVASIQMFQKRWKKHHFKLYVAQYPYLFPIQVNFLFTDS